MSKLIRQRHLQAALQKVKAYMAKQISLVASAAASDLEEQGLCPCTHQKSGTVHALTAAQNAKNLRFAAAADYTAGDTFTLNGKAVTARTLSGEGLFPGFFKKGAEVVCQKGPGGLTFGVPGAAVIGRQLLDLVYPVGSIYQTLNADFRPAAAWGGTWELVAAGLALRQAGTGANGSRALGTQYGEEKHPLTADENGEHEHKVGIGNIRDGDFLYWDQNSQSQIKDYWGMTFGSEVPQNPIYARKSGKGLPHNNIGPSLSVNIWKRTK